MRRALATATIAGAVALVPVTALAASADETGLAAGVVLSQEDTDDDEPLEQDGDDDTGKYGLIGLTGLLGLFGYKKYKEHQASRSTTTGTHGGSVGDVDSDGSGSRRL